MKNPFLTGLLAFSLCFLSGQVLAALSPPEMAYLRSGTTISVAWSQTPGASGYRLYYAPYPYTGPETINFVDQGIANNVDYTLWENASYYIAVKAYDTQGESDFSNIELFKMNPIDGIGATDLSLHTEEMAQIVVEGNLPFDFSTTEKVLCEQTFHCDLTASNTPIPQSSLLATYHLTVGNSLLSHNFVVTRAGEQFETFPQAHNLQIGTLVSHFASSEIPWNWFTFIPEGIDLTKPVTFFVNALTDGDYDKASFYAAGEYGRYFNGDHFPGDPGEDNIVGLFIAIPRHEQRLDDEVEIYCMGLYPNTFTTSDDFYSRPDLKTIRIIETASQYLVDRGLMVNEKVIMEGYSAGAMFAQRFAILHPELIKMVVAGQAGGALVFPEESYNGFLMDWPVGIHDYEDYTGGIFNKEVYKDIPQFFYIGDQDTGPYQWTIHSSDWGFNDWNYNLEQSQWFYSTFGNPQPTSFQNQANFMINNGYNVTFKLYPGVGHTVTNEMMQEIWSFIRENLN